MKNNPLVTVLLVILALIVADLFLNDGRALASITSKGNDAITVQTLDRQPLQNMVQQPIVVTATPPPQIVVTATPEPPTAQPAGATPTTPPTNFGATATAFFAPTEQPTESHNPALIAVPLATPDQPMGCQGGRSCPRPTATAAPGR